MSIVKVGQIWQIAGSTGHSMDRDVMKVEGETVTLGFVDSPGCAGWEWPLNVVLRDFVLVADAPVASSDGTTLKDCTFAPVAEQAAPQLARVGETWKSFEQATTIGVYVALDEAAVCNDTHCSDAQPHRKLRLRQHASTALYTSCPVIIARLWTRVDSSSGAFAGVDPGVPGSERTVETLIEIDPTTRKRRVISETIKVPPTPKPFDPRAFLCNRTMRSGLACDLIKGHEKTVDHDCRVLPLPRAAPKGMSEADLEAAGRAAWLGRK